MAVPEGASSFPSWCSSTISAPPKYGAAISANRIMSTAPMAKLAATTQLGAPEAGPANRRSRSSKSEGVNPVVPTTAWIPASAQKASVSRAASRRVKSTATSVPPTRQGLEIARDGE